MAALNLNCNQEQLEKAVDQIESLGKDIDSIEFSSDNRLIIKLTDGSSIVSTNALTPRIEQYNTIATPAVTLKVSKFDL